jgi:dihydroneopterin aldolase
MSNKILLKNMAFYGFHGVHEFERELGQRFYVDVEMIADLSEAGESDNLDKTIDYSKVHEQIKNIMENHRFQLLEAAGHHIADMILKTTKAQTVVVRVRKPSVPLPGQLDYVEVETVRSRC